jgi:hypothetical protein
MAARHALQEHIECQMVLVWKVSIMLILMEDYQNLHYEQEKEGTEEEEKLDHRNTAVRP